MNCAMAQELAMPAFVIIVGLSLVFYVFCLVKLNQQGKRYPSSRVAVVKVKNSGLHLAGSASLPEALAGRTMRSFRAKSEDEVLRRNALRTRSRQSLELDGEDATPITTIRIEREHRQTR
jgi:hypothetical protein